MKYFAILSVALGVATAKTERYIISYDEVAWTALQSRFLITNSENILKELRIQIAELDTDEIREFSAIPGVTLEKDQEVRIADIKPSYVQENPLAWGIDRIDQRELPLDELYHYDTLASDVDVWVIDTGVNPTHKELVGHATFEQNFCLLDRKNEDCNGHGTHVSSTIAGRRVGVAKEAKIHGVKVLNCWGMGFNSGILQGINYVVEQHKKVPGRKSVINMSIGAPKSEPLNDAVKAATQAGITVVVAAGNEKNDACGTSPSSAPEAITVAASDDTDASADFTNHGECVNIYAPGQDIRGAWKGGDDLYYTISGTSMASPHVAGVAALVLSRGDAKTPEEVKKYLVDNGTKDVIKNIPAKTPNVLLYSLKSE